MGSVHWIGLQIQRYIQIQKHSVRYELCFEKHLPVIAWGSSGSNGWARVNEVERTPATNDIVLFRSPATWTRKVRHGM